MNQIQQAQFPNEDQKRIKDPTHRTKKENKEEQLQRNKENCQNIIKKHQYKIQKWQNNNENRNISNTENMGKKYENNA